VTSLVKEAGIEAKQGGERGITARSVKKVTAVSHFFTAFRKPKPKKATAHKMTLHMQNALAKFKG